jgi:hypothetical protein
MEKTKIHLSEDELLLMQNSDWILTKNNIIEKISHGFGNLAVQMQQQIAADQLRHEESIRLNSMKISRGEKYQGLPYVILDYPRIFGKEDILAIRTLFWWGNYYSITLHTKGRWQEIVLQNMIVHLDQLNRHSFYISFSGNEWSHNILDSNYIKLQYLSHQEILQKLPTADFIKLVSKVEIGPWVDMEKRLFNLFLYLVKLIRH